MSKFKAFSVNYKYPGAYCAASVVIAENEEQIKEVLLKRVGRCHPDNLSFSSTEICFDKVRVKDLTLADLLKAINN